MIKNEFIDLYEELSKLNEWTEYPYDKAYKYFEDDFDMTYAEAKAIPEWAFEAEGIDRDAYLRKIAAREHSETKYSSSSKNDFWWVKNKLGNDGSDTFYLYYQPLKNIPQDERIKASKVFWAQAKSGRIDIDTFHKAFDEDMMKHKFINFFESSGRLDRRRAGEIALYLKTLPNPDWSIRALMKLCWATKNNQIYSSKDDAYFAKREEEKKIRDAWTSAVDKEVNKVLPTPDWNDNYRVSKDSNDIYLYSIVDSNNELEYHLSLPGVEWLVTDPVEVAKIALDQYNKGKGYTWCGR